LTIGGNAAMGAAAATTYNKYIVLFSFEPGSQVWVALNEIAEAPAGASFATTTSELNPSARTVKAGDVLHFYTDDATGSVVSAVIYALF